MELTTSLPRHASVSGDGNLKIPCLHNGGSTVHENVPNSIKQVLNKHCLHNIGIYKIVNDQVSMNNNH